MLLWLLEAKLNLLTNPLQTYQSPAIAINYISTSYNPPAWYTHF